MGKTKRKSNRELLQEARQEGMFKEAREFTQKKKYVASSKIDNILIYLVMIIGILVFVIINRIFKV